MAVRNELLIAPERPARAAAPAQVPAPVPMVPWWSGRRAPHDRPHRPEGVERWRTDLVVAVPTSRRRRRGLVLLRPLAAGPRLVVLVGGRLGVCCAPPAARGGPRRGAPGGAAPGCARRPAGRLGLPRRRQRPPPAARARVRVEPAAGQPVAGVALADRRRSG